MKEQRIQAAALAGYENASKFSAAFKSVFSQTPLAYRNRNK